MVSEVVAHQQDVTDYLKGVENRSGARQMGLAVIPTV